MRKKLKNISKLHMVAIDTTQEKEKRKQRTSTNTTSEIKYLHYWIVGQEFGGMEGRHVPESAPKREEAIVCPLIRLHP